MPGAAEDLYALFFGQSFLGALYVIHSGQHPRHFQESDFDRHENNMDAEKTTNPGAMHYEEQPLETVATCEYEPTSDYRVHWRTKAAIFSLAMGNVCAAMSNTVGLATVVFNNND